MNSIVGYIIAELVRFFKKKLKIYRAEGDDMLAIGEMIYQVCDLDKKTASEEAVIFGGASLTKVEP